MNWYKVIVEVSDVDSEGLRFINQHIFFQVAETEQHACFIIGAEEFADEWDMVTRVYATLENN